MISAHDYYFKMFLDENIKESTESLKQFKDLLTDLSSSNETTRQFAMKHIEQATKEKGQQAVDRFEDLYAAWAIRLTHLNTIANGAEITPETESIVAEINKDVEEKIQEWKEWILDDREGALDELNMYADAFDVDQFVADIDGDREGFEP